jgi:hypothetical protein
MHIDILYFEGCPNGEPARVLVERILSEERLIADVTMVEIDDMEAVQAHRFFGSPTIQVNGVDIEPARRADTHYAMACRIYEAPEGASGVPPADMIRAALRSGV